jgi:hypothetical protein
VAGSDVCVIAQTSCTKDIRGIDITVGGFIQTHKGLIIGIMQKAP